MEKLRARRAEIRRLKRNLCNQLTLGQKISKVIIGLVKTALIVVAGLAGLSVIAGVAIAIFVAYAIVSAIAGGFADASRAYRSGDQYVRWF